jgi:hypothetical protein
MLVFFLLVTLFKFTGIIGLLDVITSGEVEPDFIISGESMTSFGDSILDFLP